MTREKAFSGPQAWLSSMYLCTVWYKGIEYPARENAYQAAKFEDEKIRQSFVGIDPYAAKKRGGKRGPLVKLLRADWSNHVKVAVMEDLVCQQVANHSEIREKLLATQDTSIVEINDWGDTFWGVCRGTGLNYLGRIWMQARIMAQNGAL